MTRVPGALADAGVLLLSGGLTMLGAILVLVLVQSALPRRDPQPPRSRRLGLQPLGTLPPPPGRTTHPVDAALYRFTRAGLGEVRILRVRGPAMVLAVHGCPCGSGDASGCAMAREALAAGLGRRVAERRCRRTTGGDACVFEAVP